MLLNLCHGIISSFYVPVGSLIRVMRRLEELLGELVQVSKTIGNEELEKKFKEAIRLIKRDIIFAASLYLWLKWIQFIPIRSYSFRFDLNCFPVPKLSLLLDLLIVAEKKTWGLEQI